jgi:hypothetical protein
MEIFEFLGIFLICIIFQTIGFSGCMENQTDKGYTGGVSFTGDEFLHLKST